MTTLIPKFDLMNGGSTPLNAINRPINEKLQDIVSVKDFGATGDGVTDDSAAIQAAVTYINKSGGKLIFPSANGEVYLVETEIIIDVSSIVSGFAQRYIFEIDGQGAYVIPAMGSAGSVFKIRGAALDYQSMVSIHNFVVYSTQVSGATALPLQAIAFINAEGGGYQNLEIYNIKSGNVVALGTVVWFSEQNTGFMDGITVHDINFSYAGQTGSIIVATKKAGVSQGVAGQVRFYNLWITSGNLAIDWFSWSPGPVTRGNGSQACIYVDSVVFAQAHIGPWIGGNPFAIFVVNTGLIQDSIIENVYSELYQSALVYGLGVPTAISSNLLNCQIVGCRQYFDRIAFAGAARLYTGQAINCHFVNPVISIQGTAPVSTDLFITLNTGSFGNTFDPFNISNSSPVETNAYYVNPSQHIVAQTATDKQNNEFRPFRTSTPIQFSMPDGTITSAAVSPAIATIPAYFLNTNNLIKVSARFRTTATGAGAAVTLATLIDGQFANTSTVTLTSANPEVECSIRIRFNGGVDKTYVPTASFHFSSTALQSGIAPVNF